LKLFGDIKIDEKEIRTVKYESKLVLFVKEETVVQGKIDRLIEIERYYGMEMNEEKLGKETFKATICLSYQNRSKTTAECGVFHLFV
jgi:hypothetical protein